MSHLCANDTATQFEMRVGNYVTELEQLPGSQRLGAASQSTIHAMASSLLQSGQLQQASAYFSFLLLHAPTNPDYLSARASCAMQAGEPAHAVELLSLALYVQPESCGLALALAEAMLATGAVEGARQLLLLVRRLAQLPADASLQARADLLLQALPADRASHAA